MTFLMLPEQAGRPRRLAISRRALRVIGVLLGCICLLLVWTLIDYVDVKLDRIRLMRELSTTTVERDALIDHTAYQTHQIDALSGELNSLETEVREMARLDASIRQVTNLKQPDSGALMTGGVGHPASGGPQAAQSANHDFNSMHLKVDDLLGDARAVRSSMSELDAYFADRRGGFASTPSIWPVKGWVSSEFGIRNDPLTGISSMHEGLDIATAYGTPILAPGNGVVSFAGAWGGYGNTVMINHGQGVSTLYGHLSACLVHSGQKIRRGEALGLIGTSGRSTGPHLHYEVQVNNVPVNPRLYILQ
ncbi:MAG: M23 family metallopeptidase [Candidatus Alcyoniella australis]|nr:M23 family metallopeptidase [Candidatus Alcyoniella australis]